MKTKTSINARLASFAFNLKTASANAAWERLVSSFGEQGIRLTRSVGARSLAEISPGSVLTLETRGSDGWNARSGGNTVFLYDACYWHTPGFGVAGYHIIDTAEIAAARNSAVRCGYCGLVGWQEPGDPWHCTACLGSPHLEPTELHMPRLAPLLSLPLRSPLSPAETAEITAAYETAQRLRKEAREASAPERLAKYRTALADDYYAAVKAAEAEYNGRIDMLNRGLTPETVRNTVYYPRDNTWAFGLFEPVEENARAEIMTRMSGFAWTWCFK